ncbi:hypothetical protein C1I89_17480 [Achromobacter pulmonis]|uniref:Uncharacterized protein n=1 Tax=Achromobacter pulmonis TaxID=1389932 RepID=A0A2N8KH84_9BURK|nr:hypothetical protein C1I89_17480 [Achromobacter pulmonis]
MRFSFPIGESVAPPYINFTVFSTNLPNNTVSYGPQIAIQEALDGKNVEWMEHVSDEQDLAGRPRG